MRRILRIDPYRFPVEDGDPGVDDNGEFDSEKGLITIRKGLITDTYADTLLHETGHAISFVSGVAGTLLTNDQEEQYLRSTTPYLLNALRNNRWLLRALGIEV